MMAMHRRGADAERGTGGGGSLSLARGGEDDGGEGGWRRGWIGRGIGWWFSERFGIRMERLER